jgi:hypothetical protein
LYGNSLKVELSVLENLLICQFTNLPFDQCQKHVFYYLPKVDTEEVHLPFSAAAGPGTLDANESAFLMFAKFLTLN